MATFKLKVDAEFEAADLEAACFALIAHFMAVGDIKCYDVDSCSLPQSFLDFVGSMQITKEPS